jgi:hypothetical protein
MAAPDASIVSDTFLNAFGTPTLLWRVLHLVSYAEPPCYTWKEVETQGQQPWFDVQVTVPPREDHPQWLGWIIESNGQTPWEGAQVVAMEVLLAIYQEFGDELVNGPARTIPRVDLAEAFWMQLGDNPLVMGNTELAQSTSPTISAMMAILKVYYSC